MANSPRKRHRSPTAPSSPPPAPPKRHHPVIPPPAPFYPFAPLMDAHPPLRPYLTPHIPKTFSRTATHHLTLAILRLHFNLSLFLPPQHLTPTIPNRVQYLQWAFSLLQAKPSAALDICTGPSCIYPLLASQLFPDVKFTATDVDPEAISLAKQNVLQNQLATISVLLTDANTLLPPNALSHNPSIVICNPPFHDAPPDSSNPAGTNMQLATPGGELAFLKKLAEESRSETSVEYFTSLVGKKRDLKPLMVYLRSPHVRARVVHGVELKTGGRTVRWAVAWKFGELKSRVWKVEGGKWRIVCGVQVSRRYSNLLPTADIVSLFKGVLEDMEWKAESEDGVMGRDEGTIGIVVQEGDGWGCWVVTIKVLHKGKLEEGEWKTLCKNVIEGVRKFLDFEESEEGRSGEEVFVQDSKEGD